MRELILSLPAISPATRLVLLEIWERSYDEESEVNLRDIANKYNLNPIEAKTAFQELRRFRLCRSFNATTKKFVWFGNNKLVKQMEDIGLKPPEKPINKIKYPGKVYFNNRHKKWAVTLYVDDQVAAKNLHGELCIDA